MNKNRRTLVLGIIVAIAMFAFGFALVPMYNVLCSVTGLNGKTYNESVPLAPTSEIDYQRNVEVQFVTSTNGQLPWKFYPKTNNVSVHPGENKLVYFYAENVSDQGMVVQAIPSVSPGEAAKYLKKTECFCFTQEYLGAHKAVLMPVLFHFEPQLPVSITMVTLSYTMFDASHFIHKNTVRYLTPA
jgi:cytochrome c oxidase assembly protein subunit 11